MRQFARRLRLAVQPLLQFCQLFGISHEIEANCFESHRPVDSRVNTLIDRAHRAFAEHSVHLIATQIPDVGSRAGHRGSLAVETVI
jgi:hypothetical protein